jgi:biopolymer transport protein ExbB
MTWREAWGYGGRIMWVLTAMSVAGLALAIYFLLALRPGQVAPPALRSLVVARLRTGEVHEARQACEARPCPLSVVTLAGLDYLRGTTRTDPLLLREILEGEGSRQAQAIESQTQLLLDLAVIAPMLGLLGTVLGMLKAFGAVAHDVAAARPVVLAEGVTQAIITTVYGLLVAIPAMLAYTYFRRRAARQVFQLEASATEVLTALLARDEP